MTDNNKKSSPYLEEFKSIENMDKEFHTTIPRDIEILLAWYGYGSYSGESYVLFRRDGKLYENNASHCSCYGLEGQWKPEEISLKYLVKMDKDGGKFYDGYDGAHEATLKFHDVINLLLEKSHG